MMMALMLCLIPITSYAEIKAAKEPADMNKTAAELNGCTEEEWARLMDNRLEYDEIEKLGEQECFPLLEIYTQYNSYL